MPETFVFYSTQNDTFNTIVLVFLCLVRSTDTLRKRLNPLVSASYMANYYVIRIKLH